MNRSSICQPNSYRAPSARIGPRSLRGRLRRPPGELPIRRSQLERCQRLDSVGLDVGTANVKPAGGRGTPRRRASGYGP